ncbi:MAG: tRNA adenosine(34) deaminase TadA [Thermaerobacterales bacterium]
MTHCNDPNSKIDACSGASGVSIDHEPGAGDDVFMRLALAEARLAEAAGEVPVGAVIVRDGVVLAKGHNRRETGADPTAHAEIVALRAAGRQAGTWRLDGATLYVTLEPCAMCAGAMVLARLERLVFGALDRKAGAAQSLMNLVQDDRLNHRLEVTAGVMSDQCGELLRAFFRRLRG